MGGATGRFGVSQLHQSDESSVSSASSKQLY